jgi:hypothetical protein
MTVHYMDDYRGINRSNLIKNTICDRAKAEFKAQVYCSSFGCTIVFNNGTTFSFSVLSGMANITYRNSMDSVTFKPFSASDALSRIQSESKQA